MKDYIRSYAEEVNSKFRRLNNLVSHNLSIGTYHEVVIRNILEKFLSKRCAIKTGFVLNRSKNAVSKQVDILVIDENNPAPYYFVEGDFVVAKHDSVLLGIEIKSVLDKAGFTSAMENSIQFRSTGNGAIFTVFAYTTTYKTNETLSNWYKDIDGKNDKAANYPGCIYILNHGLIQLLHGKYAKPWGHYTMSPKDNSSNIETFVMAYFISTIIKQVEMGIGKESNPFEDFDMEESLVTHIAYRFGKGGAPAVIDGDIINTGMR